MMYIFFMLFFFCLNYSSLSNAINDRPIPEFFVDQILQNVIEAEGEESDSEGEWEEDVRREVELERIDCEQIPDNIAIQQKRLLLEAQQNNFDNVMIYLELINRELTTIENNNPEDIHSFNNVNFLFGGFLLWKTYAGCSLFMQAVIYNRLDVINRIFHLVNRLYNFNISVRQLMYILLVVRDNNGDTPLLYAAKHNKESVIRLIVMFLEPYFYYIFDDEFTKEFLQESSFLKDNTPAQPALFYLVEQGSESAVRNIVVFLVHLEEQEILDLHDIVFLMDTSGAEGCNLLGIARYSGYEDIVKTLSDYTLGYFIFYLINSGQLERAEFCIKEACQKYSSGEKTIEWLYSVLKTCNKRMTSVLMLAVQNNHYIIAEKILIALGVVARMLPTSNAFTHEVFERKNNNNSSVALLVARGRNNTMIELFNRHTLFVCHQTFRDAGSEEVRQELDGYQTVNQGQQVLAPALPLREEEEQRLVETRGVVEYGLEDYVSDNLFDIFEYSSDSDDEIDLDSFFE